MIGMHALRCRALAPPSLLALVHSWWDLLSPALQGALTGLHETVDKWISTLNEAAVKTADANIDLMHSGDDDVVGTGAMLHLAYRYLQSCKKARRTPCVRGPGRGQGLGSRSVGDPRHVDGRCRQAVDIPGSRAQSCERASNRKLCRSSAGWQLEAPCSHQLLRSPRFSAHQPTARPPPHALVLCPSGSPWPAGRMTCSRPKTRPPCSTLWRAAQHGPCPRPLLNPPLTPPRAPIPTRHHRSTPPSPHP